MKFERGDLRIVAGGNYIGIYTTDNSGQNIDLDFSELDFVINSLQTIRQTILNETTQTTLNQEEMK